MQTLQRQLAACCLQRTFARNREQRRVREIVHDSIRPMYLRARDFGSAQRAKVHVAIVESAVYVMQSTWRKHAQYVRWTQTRINAALVLQSFLLRVVERQKWRRLVLHATQSQQTKRRWDAAQRIQTCWCLYRKRQADKAHAACLQQIEQLARFVRASCCLQRCYRRHRDPWRRVVQRVLDSVLPRQRCAAQCIRVHWLRFAARKHALLQQLHGRERVLSLPKRMDLQQLVLAQELAMQRENEAVKCIQHMFQRRIDARDGKRLLQKYRILMRQEMARRQQRRIIHEFLGAKQTNKQQRARKPQSLVATRGSSSSGGHHAATAVADEHGGDDTLLSAVAARDPGVEGSSESVRYWSHEHQRAYLFNARTGESTWL